MSTEVTEQNKIIAEFMGWRACDGEKTVYTKETAFTRHVSTFKYHEDWNQLMPVVEKIKDMKLRENWDRKKPVMNALYDVDINILHKAAYDFIQWYQSVKK